MLGESIGTDSNDIHQYTIDKTTLYYITIISKLSTATSKVTTVFAANLFLPYAY